MLDRAKRMVREDGGQDLAEYGIALALIGVMALAGALATGVQVGNIWDSVDSTISSVAHTDHGHHRGGGNSGKGGGNGPG
jgi:Flp pilus assembly pilin Flp